MPRDNSRSRTGETTAGSWQNTLIDRMRIGKVTPVISNVIGDDLVLGGHERLVQRYAEDARYPSAPLSFASVAQFRSITDEEIADALALREQYIDFAKNRLFDLAESDQVSGATLLEVQEQFDDLKFLKFCDQLGYPRFDNLDNPLLLLADLSCPIYVTTCYHHFIEAALTRAGKKPRTDFCRWHRDLERYPTVFVDGYDPTDPKYRHEPLVYHLHGSSVYPDSLVLTEDDHLQFMVAACEGFGSSSKKDPVHTEVRQAMNESLLVLGYSLSSWDFRSLFWGLIQKRSRKLLSAVTIQLTPSDLEKLYLQKYMGNFEFKVHWGDVQGFVKELHGALAR